MVQKQVSENSSGPSTCRTLKLWKMSMKRVHNGQYQAQVALFHTACGATTPMWAKSTSARSPRQQAVSSIFSTDPISPQAPRFPLLLCRSIFADLVTSRSSGHQELSHPFCSHFVLTIEGSLIKTVARLYFHILFVIS